jgi:hypothetical protein
VNQNPLDKEPYLRSKLNEYHIEVPDFPMKTSKWGRFIQFLASPTKDPLESVVSTENGILALKIAPAAGGIGLVLVQILFFI